MTMTTTTDHGGGCPHEWVWEAEVRTWTDEETWTTVTQVCAHCRIRVTVRRRDTP
jgi:hypothetical protein